MAIGVPDEVKGEALVVFAVLGKGQSEDETVRREVADVIVAELGKSLAPKKVLFVSDLPKTATRFFAGRNSFIYGLR